MATGITKRHSRTCRSREGGRCNCEPAFEAWVWSGKDAKKVAKRFPSHAAARSWRADAMRQVDQGALRASTGQTLRSAADEWLAGADAATIRNRSGDAYKPATLRGYRQALADRVLPVIGANKLSAITTPDLQALVELWQGEGRSASSIRNAIKPLQAIYRRAKVRDGLPVNPTQGLQLPAPRPREVEIVSPYTAATLLIALPADDRAVWGTALYCGLRYGELRALRWTSVELASRKIEVRESWDPKAGRVEPKTRTSRRTVPMPVVLHELLLDRRLSHAGAPEGDLVFGDGGKPFHAASLYRRADAAWAELDDRLRLHQARHTYASFMIAAGVNAKGLATYMGHSSITVTFDLYGHLMPGAEAEAAGLLDAYLEAAVS